MVTDFVPICQSRLCPALKFPSKSYDYSREAKPAIRVLIVLSSATFPYLQMSPTSHGRDKQTEPNHLATTLSGAGEVEQNRYVSVTNTRFPEAVYLFFRIGTLYLHEAGEMLDRPLVAIPKAQ